MPLSGASAAGGLTAEDLLIRLSAGQASPTIAEALPLLTGEPLSEEEIAAILARLPELTGQAGDLLDFNLPADSPPPPRPGETVSQPFPPPAPPVVPPEIAAGPLEVLRYSPEGPIKLAPFINVTFNQPMVPLATLEALAAEQVPVLIEPAMPGTWKWLGTQTLRFEYASDLIDRLPMATEYRVTVPAGTTSVTGGVLAADVSWTMTTPAVTLSNSYPYGDPQPLTPVMVAVFDQRIDPAAVLAVTRVTAGGQNVPIRMATAEELAAREGASRTAENALESRWLALVPQEPLPADTDITVTIGPNTPSAEGPLLNTGEMSFGFRTYAPLKIVDYGCSWYGDTCPPLTPWYVRFNNPLDADAYQETMLSVEPALEGATVNVVYDTVNIEGMSVGRTSYRLTFDESLKDVFGQTLGRDQQVTIKVGPAGSVLVGPQNPLVTLDPAASKPVLSVFSINYSRLNLTAYRVDPSDWYAFKLYMRSQYDKNPPPIPGVKVLDKTLRIEAAEDQLTEVRVDLSEALPDGQGNLIVFVEPPSDLFNRNNDPYSNRVQVWVQATQIGLDAFADHSQLVAWATALADGAPLDGVSIENDAGQVVATTGPDGVARIDLASGSTSMLVARHGDDLAFLPRASYYWGDDVWALRPVSDELRWYTFDDRAMYKPGEEVHLKGWMRRVGGTQTGDIGLLGDAVTRVTYNVFDPVGNQILSGEAQVNALGGFDFAFTLPDPVNLGYASISLDARGSVSNLYNTNWYHSFQIQEFRRPEFEVTARNETTGPYCVGEDAVVAVSAHYYAGGPLPNAEITWTVSCHRPAATRRPTGPISPLASGPPGGPTGTWAIPYESDYRGYSGYRGAEAETVETFSGVHRRHRQELSAA